MERFLALLLAGGGALVAGLWLERAVAAWSSAWLAAVALVVAGVLALGAGVARELSL